MMDPAVRILAKAIYDVVDTEDERKEELGKTMRGDFNEFDLRPHFEDLSPNEKAACSDRAENLAVEHNQAEPDAVRPDTDENGRPMIDNAPTDTGMSWSDSPRKP
jgi:hypothetical protein